MNTPVPLILDTDIDTDCDDAGALAVLHAYAKQGKAEILGIVCSLPVPWCAPCVQAIDAFYGRPEIPVGVMHRKDWRDNPAFADYHAHRLRCTNEDRQPLYNQQITQAQSGEDSWPQEDAVRLYRRLLANAPEKSVVICAIGTLTALAGLLESGADEHSPLTGMELVTRKVRSMAAMAIASYPAGKDRFNWKMDIPSAAAVLNRWPVELAVNEWGQEVFTGERLCREVGEGHPIRKAYEIFHGKPANRPSWDQLTLRYAVEGAVAGFHERKGLHLTLDPQTGEHHWQEIAEGRHLHLTLAESNELHARAVENLMLAAGR